MSIYEWYAVKVLVRDRKMESCWRGIVCSCGEVEGYITIAVAVVPGSSSSEVVNVNISTRETQLLSGWARSKKVPR